MDIVRRLHLVAPWAGLIAGFLAWAVGQQSSMLLVAPSCALGQPWSVLAAGLVSLLLAGAGMIVSLRVWRSGSAEESEPGEGSRRFIGALSTGLAAIFILAILAQSLAAALLNGCER
jgi:hypothetical protein